MNVKLAIVMPVYNEEECIGRVLESWLDTLEQLESVFRFIVLNDGSSDGTRQVLDGFNDDGRVSIIHKENSGHGPTVLQGYQRAVEIADWVFQCDSDDEMRAASFWDLWDVRQGVDAVFGIRSGRQQTIDRRAISMASRALVRVLFGSAVVDVNVPYRLMRARILAGMLEQIPPNTFAPNIFISGAFASGEYDVKNVPVPHYPRSTGAPSLGGGRLWRNAVVSLGQTLAYYVRTR